MGRRHPFLIAVAGLLAIYGPGLLRDALGSHHVRHTKQAIKLLRPKEQQKILDFWRAPSRYRAHDHQPLTNAYTKREDVYGTERILTTRDTSALQHHGALLPRLLKWGFYPVLAAGVPKPPKKPAPPNANRKESAARRNAPTKRREPSAKPPKPPRSSASPNCSATPTRKPPLSSTPSDHITPGLNQVVYLPEAPQHEPDPARPGVLIKSPALAVHINSGGGYSGMVRAYTREINNCHGLNLERRLQAAHPSIYASRFRS